MPLTNGTVTFYYENESGKNYKKDLEGTLIRHIEMAGYEIENREIVQETEHRIDTTFLKIKYDMLIGILCIGFVIIFVSMMKNSRVDTDFVVC